jgi:hypothetical protein
MRKYNYRLYFNSMGYRGTDFNKLSEATQDDIEDKLQSYTVPMSINIDASIQDTIFLKIGSNAVEFDKETVKAFTDWFTALPMTKFGNMNNDVELWRDQKEDEE